MPTIYEVDLDLITPVEKYEIILNETLYPEIAERFKIPQVYEIAINADLAYQRDLWVLSGSVSATIQLKCVQSHELFDATFNVPFHVVLSNYEINDDMLDVELLQGSKADIGEIAIQYLALEIPINPVHPKIAAQVPIPSSLSEEETPSWKKALEKLKLPK
jgi:uncharacterized metal-binding protein YceD (DUF177 family)